MRSAWKEYFIFNKRERRGVFVLSLMNLFMLALLAYKPVLFPETFPRSKAERISPRFPDLKSGQQEFVPFNRKEGNTFSKRQKQPLLELNTADSSQLVMLRGIGPSFAKRIIRYRDRLGGFVASTQLMEVYGMDTSRYILLCEQIKLDLTRVRGLNINVLPADSLRKHPYFRWNLSNLIVTYRVKHGPFSQIEDLRKLDLVNDSVYVKIAPYCRVQ